MSSIKVLILVAIFVSTTLLCVPTNINAFPVVQRSVSTKRQIASVVTVAALPSKPQEQVSNVSKMIAAVITANTMLIPIVQALVEDDNYEYGAVDAPIGIAVGGGLLAILTALLPVALKGGEEAFEEIKDRDVDTFGKRNTDLLKKKK